MHLALEYPRNHGGSPGLLPSKSVLDERRDGPPFEVDTLRAYSTQVIFGPNHSSVRPVFTIHLVGVARGLLMEMGAWPCIICIALADGQRNTEGSTRGLGGGLGNLFMIPSKVLLISAQQLRSGRCTVYRARKHTHFRNRDKCCGSRIGE